MDEVIQYSHQKFNNGKGDCDIFLIGFSMGGNHIMRYLGAAKKNILCNEDENILKDESHNVKGCITVSAPFDVQSASMNI